MLYQLSYTGFFFHHNRRAYFTKTSSPNLTGLCGLGFTIPESDHWLRRRSGSTPSERFRFAVHTEPAFGGAAEPDNSAKFSQGIASSSPSPDPCRRAD